MRRKSLTRREFLEETSVGVAAAGLIPIPKRARPAIATDATAANPLLDGDLKDRSFQRAVHGNGAIAGGDMARADTASTGFERPLIFPAPQQMELRGAPFLLNPECTLVLPLRASSSESSLDRFLTEELSDRYDLQLKKERLDKLPPAGKFILIGSIQNPLVRDFCHQNQLDVSPQNPGPEGYVLRVSEHAVVVAGSDDRGAFYGLQSLRQMISRRDGGIEIPGAQVQDWPDKPFRGFKLYLPGQTSIPFFRRFVREVLALYKFNTLMVEMNGCMRLDRHPEVNAGAIECARDTNYSRRNYPPGPLHDRRQNSSHQDCCDGSFLEKDEVASLVRWAESHQMEVVPEIPSFTHSFYLLARHRDLSDVPGDKWPDTFCPSEPRSYQLLFEVMDEYIEVMKPRMIHTGHDEWFAPFGICPRCQGKDPGEILGQDLRKVHDHLANQNIKMAIWGDYLLQTVRGQGLQKRSTPSGWSYTSSGGMTPQQVKELVPKDILLFNWLWSEELHGLVNEMRLDELGFRQIYGNMEPDIVNYVERSKRPTIIGGAPSSWSAMTEFNISKDMMFSTLGCGNMLWAKKTLELPAVAKITQGSLPWLRPRLRGMALPSEVGDTVVPLDISNSFNMSMVEPGLNIDLHGVRTGNFTSGRLRFDLAGASAGVKTAVAVGTEGQRPNPLPRETVVKVGEDVTSLLFLHACAEPATNKEAYRLIWDMVDSADLLGWYEVVYEDSMIVVIPIRYGMNILEWNWGQEGKPGGIAGPHKNSGKGCYDAEALICGNAGEPPVTFFAFEWANPRLGKIIAEVRLKGAKGFRGAVPGFKDTFGEVIPNNAVILKALSYVQKRG